MSNPLIEDPSIKRASGLIISITGGKDTETCTRWTKPSPAFARRPIRTPTSSSERHSTRPWKAWCASLWWRPALTMSTLRARRKWASTADGARRRGFMTTGLVLTSSPTTDSVTHLRPRSALRRCRGSRSPPLRPAPRAPTKGGRQDRLRTMHAMRRHRGLRRIARARTCAVRRMCPVRSRTTFSILRRSCAARPAEPAARAKATGFRINFDRPHGMMRLVGECLRQVAFGDGA